MSLFAGDSGAAGASGASGALGASGAASASSDPRVSRRTALKAFSAAVLLPALSPEGVIAFARLQAAQAVSSPKVLSAAAFATLETLVEAIIPADERSPGAKDARVADYIDLLLSESDDELVLQWLGGLAALDQEAASRFQKPFGRLDAQQIDAVLSDVSRNELDPQTPLEHFFDMTKHATIRGYYSSEIGIHRELRYKGNQFLQEFVGCATEDGKDCPHCKQVGRVGRSAGRQVGRSAGRQVGRSAGRQVGRSAGRQVGRSAGRQVGR